MATIRQYDPATYTPMVLIDTNFNEEHDTGYPVHTQTVRSQVEAIVPEDTSGSRGYAI